MVPQTAVQAAARADQLYMLTLRVLEVDDIIIIEDVHLLNAWDGVHPKALKSVLQPLIVSGGGLVDSLLLSAGVYNFIRAQSSSTHAIWPAYSRQYNTCLLTVPFPPVRTAPAIFISFSRSMANQLRDTRGRGTYQTQQEGGVRQENALREATALTHVDWTVSYAYENDQVKREEYCMPACFGLPAGPMACMPACCALYGALDKLDWGQSSFLGHLYT